ncbi:MAG: family 16 glycosylhydrolase [Gammaproteobacteria bacterium]
MKYVFSIVLIALSLTACAGETAAPSFSAQSASNFVLTSGSSHFVTANTEVTLVAQVANTAWFRLFVDGVKICDVRQPRPFYVCRYTTSAVAGSVQVEVRTNRSTQVTPDSPNASFFSTLVSETGSSAISLTPDSEHDVQAGSQVVLQAQVPGTAWFRMFVNGVKICDLREPRPVYQCAYTVPVATGRYEVEVRTNTELVVTPDNPNQQFFSALTVGGEAGDIVLFPDSTHSVATNTPITFAASVPDTQWFRLFVDGVKICDVREARPLYRCAYETATATVHHNIEVRTNASTVASEGSPNISFFSALAVVSPDYVLHFDEEFNDTHGGRINPAYWDYNTGSVINNERQCYTSDDPAYQDAGISNVRVETRTQEGQSNGYLVLELKKENVSCLQANGQTFQYTSGAVSTRKDGFGTPYLVDMPHGIYEVRAKVPAGRGTWPAIWLLGKKDHTPESPFTIGWPDAGEIDLMEAVGFEEAQGLHRTHHTLHRNKSNGFLWPHRRPGKTGQGMTFAHAEPVSENFHVYRLVWKPGSIEMFVDDVRVTKMDLGDGVVGDREGFFRDAPDMNGYGHDHTPLDDHLGWPWAKEAGNEFKLILNLAWGGGWGGQQGLDDSIFDGDEPVEMLVDYVRIYAGTVIPR